MDNEAKKYHNFLKAQVLYVETSKYFEGLHTNKDPGDMYIIAWINEHAKDFRDKWNKSKCQHCYKANLCGDKLIPEGNECKYFVIL